MGSSSKSLPYDFAVVGLGLVCALAVLNLTSFSRSLILSKSEVNELKEETAKPHSGNGAVAETLVSVTAKSTNSVRDRSRKLLFVGVISAGRFLNTRIAACNHTWGQNIPRDSIQYFVGTAPEEEYSGVDIVTLPGASDHEYPPQGKAFRMLRYMCDHHLDNFSWFLRADDDAYFRVEKLQAWLRTRDPSMRYYIGQAGYGRANDKGRLHLGDANFCMGGPGVIFSRSMMQGLCPHIDECMNDKLTLTTGEEDVEIGRCIYKKLNLQCTSAYEFMKLFYHAYPQEYTVHPYLSTDLVKKVSDVALSLHHVKIPHVMFSIHNYFVSGLRGAWRGTTSSVIQLLTALRSEDTVSRLSSFQELKVPTLINLKEVVLPDQSNSAANNAKSGEELSAVQLESETTDWVYIDAGSTLDISSPLESGSDKDRLRLLTLASDVSHRSLTKGLTFIKVQRLITHFNPTVGMQQLIELLVVNQTLRDSRESSPVTYQLACGQAFQEAEVKSTVVSLPAESEMVIILPLAPVHHPFFQRFMQMYTTKFLSERQDAENDFSFKTHLYVVTFPASPTLSMFQVNGGPLDPALVVSLYQSKFTNVHMRVVQATGPYSPVKALDLGVQWAHQEVEGGKLQNAVVFLSSVELDDTTNFVKECLSNAHQSSSIFFPVVSFSFKSSVPSSNGASAGGDSNEEKPKEITTWLSSSYGHLCSSHAVLSPILAQMNTTTTSLDFFQQISKHSVAAGPLNVFRAYESGLKIRWDELHTRCNELIKLVGVSAASDIFPSCSNTERV